MICSIFHQYITLPKIRMSKSLLKVVKRELYHDIANEILKDLAFCVRPIRFATFGNHGIRGQGGIVLLWSKCLHVAGVFQSNEIRKDMMCRIRLQTRKYQIICSISMYIPPKASPGSY